MNIGSLDNILCIIDIILSIIDMGLIIYLFFYRFPPEKKKKPTYDKFGYYKRKKHRCH